MTQQELIQYIKKHIDVLNNEKLPLSNDDEDYKKHRHLENLKELSRKHLSSAYLISIHIEALERENIKIMQDRKKAIEKKLPPPIENSIENISIEENL